MPKSIAILAVDSKYPNYALMKIAAYHKSIGDSVEWYDPMFGEYDELYISKIFNFTPDVYDMLTNVKGDVHRGGTGYDIHSKLPDEIDRMQPDYSIYPASVIDARTSYGFLTRGCPNKCPWCVVPRKEGPIAPYMDIDEITLNGKRPYAVLMDNNVLASPYGVAQIEKIRDKRYHVDFNQALDARLVTPEIAVLLAKVKWIDSIVRFGCDTPRQIIECEKVMDMMLSAGYGGQFLVYTIINSDFDESFARIEHWHHNKKVRVAAQPFRDPDNPHQIIPQWQKDLAHWANRRELYRTCDFRDFSPRKGFTCKEYFN